MPEITITIGEYEILIQHEEDGVVGALGITVFDALGEEIESIDIENDDEADESEDDDEI